MNIRDLLLRRRMMMDWGSPFPPPSDMLHTPMTFEAIEDGTGVYFSSYREGDIDLPVIEFSLDDGGTWEKQSATEAIHDEGTGEYDYGEPLAVLNVGDKVRFRCENYKTYEENSTDDNYAFINNYLFCSKPSYVYGNIMSIVAGENYVEAKNLGDANLYMLFAHDIDGAVPVDYYVTHPTNDIILPATELNEDGYSNMFWKCNGLTRAPELPATTLTGWCYAHMFLSCSNLTTPPELPALTLSEGCYEGMFAESGLTTAPELLATELAEGCYYGMFSRCKSLTTAPILRARHLANRCYSTMFAECTALVNPPELPAITIAGNCYSGMFDGCSNLLSAPELPATTLAESCYSAMFRGCSKISELPVLPATILADSCYASMFNSCSSVVNTPNNYLPATNLAPNCYSGMFAKTGLINAPALPATHIEKNCYREMFEGCAELLVAPGLPATELAEACYYRMFNGCTSLTTTPRLEAQSLVNMCYSEMFKDCTSLASVVCLAENAYQSSVNTARWLRNVSPSGTFTKKAGARWLMDTEDGIPAGWTVVEV